MVGPKDFRQIATKISGDLLQNENIFLINLKENYIKDSSFPINSQVYSFHEVAGMIKIKEHYNIGNQSQTIQSIGRWQNSKLFLTYQSLLERRKNLNGLQIRAETLSEYPYNFDVLDGKITGIIGDLWHGIIEPSLNFTTTISSPPDGNWGSVNEDGSWNGMVGGLL